MTSALALPNPAIDAVANVERDEPKKGSQGGKDAQLGADLHHVSKSGFCANLSKKSSRKSCGDDLEKCEKKKGQQEEDCENDVKKKYKGQ